MPHGHACGSIISMLDQSNDVDVMMSNGHACGSIIPTMLDHHNNVDVDDSPMPCGHACGCIPRMLDDHTDVDVVMSRCLMAMHVDPSFPPCLITIAMSM
jgi:hypothetical protein